MTKFGQIVIGPPGAGALPSVADSSELRASRQDDLLLRSPVNAAVALPGLKQCRQFYTALERPISVVNLDPACLEPPYQAEVSISSLITLDDAMAEFGLGPNGAMLYCLEYLESNFEDWLVPELQKIKSDYIVFDLPGQVELSTDHASLRNIIGKLEKLDFRVAAVHLTDAHHISDASKYVAVLLLALRTMLQLELPHVNILSKIDLLGDYGQLPFNLDFYTEVQDLSYLTELLEEEQTRSRGKRMTALNRAICGLVEDYGLVGFETLCVEDKESMYNVMRTIDKAIGYQPPYQDKDDTQRPDEIDFSQLLNPLDTIKTSQALAAQERWLDEKADFDQYDRAGWQDEGKRARQAAESK